MAKTKDPLFSGRVNVEVSCYRYRLVDPDDAGGCFKYHLDALVDAGVLRDDSCKEIANFKKVQKKISKEEKEMTVITITEVEEVA